MSMNAGNVTGSGATQAYYQNLKNKHGGGAQESNNAETAAATDAYTGGKGKVAGAYSKDSATMQQLYDMAEANHASMRSMVESMLGVGGGKGSHHGQAFWSMAANPDKFEFPVRVDDATRAKAQELIGEDGYFGVKKVTERIMEFAKALAGSNPSEKEVDNLLDGVKKGFDAVAKMFGGFDKLPDVTKDTYNSVMKAFDDWKVELGFAAAEK